MCIASAIMDYQLDKWKQPGGVPDWPLPYIPPVVPGPSQLEFDKLKKEVEELRKMLIAAKIYDEANNEPHCEHKEKVAAVKKIADLVGVDLSDLI